MWGETVLTILLDENLEGYAAYLTRLVFSPEWSEISSMLGVRIVTLEQVGLSKGTPDEQIWELCQQQQFFLVTDNRNEEKPDSLERMIRTNNRPTSLPVFTISDVNRFRNEHNYVEAVVAKLLEYLFDADNILGAGRLYLP
jgi:Domain of unknown function (DUF5615)